MIWLTSRLAGAEGYEAYDERVLGSGDFVEQLWKSTETAEPPAAAMSLPERAKEVARLFAVDMAVLLQGNRMKDLSDAKGALCYVATRKMGMNGVVVAKMLNISRSGVLVAARRGAAIYEKSKELRELVSSSQPNQQRPLDSV